METAVLPNPVIKESDAEMADLERQAAEFDASSQTESDAQETPESRDPGSEVTESTDNPPGATTDNSEINPSPEKEQPRGPDGKFAPKDAKPEAGKIEGEKAKPETDYTKAQKEAQRREKSWQALEAEKQQVRAQADLLRQQQAQMQQQLTATRTSPDGRNAYSAQEYASAAKDLRDKAKLLHAKGEHDEAEQAEVAAEQAQKAAQQTYQIETEQTQHQARTGFQQQYAAVMEREFQSDPELQDPQNPIHAKLAPLLEQEPVFGILVDGFAKAKRIAQLLVKEELVSELTERATKAEAEVADLRKRTGIKGSGPAPQVQPKKLEDMTSDEQMSYLERITAEADSVSG